MSDLRRTDLATDPLEQFHRWFAEARVPVPEQMAIATATADGRPSVRMVLLKGADERGFVFHTGYESRKGSELAANPRAALLFHWNGRQVRLEGPVERTTAEESAAYFGTRAPLSRLSAVASPQSRVVSGRDELERLVEDARARHGDEPLLPDHWGGFRLRPETWEFWQHRDNRLHDRFRYRQDAGGWTIERLGP